MSTNEEDLVSAHRERLLARKREKEKIENSIRASFLTDINRDQINEINKRLSNLFRNYINKQNQIIIEE